MKKIIICFLLSYCFSFIWPVESIIGKKFYYTSEVGSIIIHNGEIDFGNNIEKGIFLESNGFGLFDGENNRYLIFNCTNDEVEFLTLIKKSNGKKYCGWEIPYAIVKSGEYEVFPELVGMNVIKAESFITEMDKTVGKIHFVPKNFNLIDIPWAVSDKSKNKVIYLNFEKNRIPLCKYKMIEELFILNGFLNPEKTYLYEQNARAKEILITYEDISEIYTLEDIGNYQTVKLPKAINPLDDTIIKLEILSSYSGEKYDDIVISGVLYVDCYKDK